MAGRQQGAEADELRCLRRIEELLTVLTRVHLSDALKTHLKDKSHRTLYELTGHLPIRQLVRKTGFSMGKISGLWQEWEQAGLLVKDGSQYRRVL